MHRKVFACCVFAWWVGRSHGDRLQVGAEGCNSQPHRSAGAAACSHDDTSESPCSRSPATAAATAANDATERLGGGDSLWACEVTPHAGATMQLDGVGCRDDHLVDVATPEPELQGLLVLVA